MIDIFFISNDGLQKNQYEKSGRTAIDVEDDCIAIGRGVRLGEYLNMVGS